MWAILHLVSLALNTWLFIAMDIIGHMGLLGGSVTVLVFWVFTASMIEVVRDSCESLQKSAGKQKLAILAVGILIGISLDDDD